MKLLIKFVLLSSFLPQLAEAEIFKKALICNDSGQTCFYWWPQLKTQEGWEQEEGASYHFRSNMHIKKGSTFATSESVIYAKALFKERKPEIKSIEALIKDDKESFLKKIPGLKISKVDKYENPAGFKFSMFEFFPPNGAGNWERVAYSEEVDTEGNDYFLIFTLSSKSKEGYLSAKESYLGFLDAYK